MLASHCCGRTFDLEVDSAQTLKCTHQPAKQSHQRSHRLKRTRLADGKVQGKKQVNWWSGIEIPVHTQSGNRKKPFYYLKPGGCKSPIVFQMGFPGRLKQLPTSCVRPFSGGQPHAAFSHKVHMARVRQKVCQRRLRSCRALPGRRLQVATKFGRTGQQEA